MCCSVLSNTRTNPPAVMIITIMNMILKEKWNISGKSVNVCYVIMACNIYKRRWTHGPCVPAEKRCASLSLTCKAFIGFIYLTASGRRIRFLLLSSCWHCAWRCWWRFKAHRCYRHDLTLRRVYKHMHTHPELSHYSSLTFDPDFTSQTKTRPPPFSLLRLYLDLCAVPTICNMQQLLFQTVVLCVTLTSSLDVLLSAVELSLLFCYILRILLKTQTQNTLLFTCSYLNSRHRKILR